MIALLWLLFAAHVQVPGSVVPKHSVCMDTIEFRKTVLLLEDREALDESNNLCMAQALVRQKSNTELASAYEAQEKALKLTDANFKSADSARKACVSEASVIAKEASSSGFKRGLLWGGGIGAVASLLLFVVGVLVGS